MGLQGGICLSAEIKQIQSLGNAMEKVVAETVWACKLENCKQIKFNELCSNGVPFYNIQFYTCDLVWIFEM